MTTVSGPDSRADGLSEQRVTASRVRWYEAVLLVAVSGLVFAELRTPLNVYDEGLGLTAGLRILAGEAPYADFWRVYPPGAFLLAATVHALGGDTVLAQRVVDVVLRIGIIGVAWLIARHLMMGAGSRVLLIVGVGVAMAVVNSHFLYPVYPTLLLVLVAFWCSMRAIDASDARWSVGAAIALVGAAVFRLDVAAYGGVSLLLAGLWARRQGTFPEVAKRLLQVVSVAGILGILVGSVLLIWVTPQAAWECLVVFPTTVMRAARGMPPPGLWALNFAPTSSWVAWYSLFVVLAVAGVAFIAATRAAANRNSAVTGALLCFSLGLVLLAASRPDRSHAMPALLTGFVVVLACISGVRARPLRVLCAIVALGVVGLQLAAGVRTMLPDVVAHAPWAPCLNAPARAGCVAVEDDQTQAVAYVRSVTSPDERIFVGNNRHDRIFIGDSSFYYLADRLPATRYDELHPGLTDQAQIQSTIIEEIRSVRYVVLWDAPESTEPNASSVGSGVTLLDDYLRSHYRTVHAAGSYQVLLLNDGP